MSDALPLGCSPLVVARSPRCMSAVAQWLAGLAGARPQQISSAPDACMRAGPSLAQARPPRRKARPAAAVESRTHPPPLAFSFSSVLSAVAASSRALICARRRRRRCPYPNRADTRAGLCKGAPPPRPAPLYSLDSTPTRPTSGPSRTRIRRTHPRRPTLPRRSRLQNRLPSPNRRKSGSLRTTAENSGTPASHCPVEICKNPARSSGSKSAWRARRRASSSTSAL